MTMPDGNTEAGSGTTETATTPPVEGQNGAVTTPAAQAATEAPPAAQGGNTVMLTSKTLKARLDKEKERGKRAALAEVEARARALGYDSADEMYKALEKHRAAKEAASETPAPKPTPAPQERQPMVTGKNGNGKLQADARAEREVERLRKQHEESERQRRHAEKQAKIARKREEEARIEAQLARAAALEGIRNDDDIEYAIHLLRSEVKNNPDKFKGSDTFDERKFFAELREKKPFLFGEAPRPATTGVSSGGESPLPPKPGQVTSQVAKNGQFDARTATKEELAKEMARQGLRFNL